MKNYHELTEKPKFFNDKRFFLCDAHIGESSPKFIHITVILRERNSKHETQVDWIEETDVVHLHPHILLYRFLKISGKWSVVFSSLRKLTFPSFCCLLTLTSYKNYYNYKQESPPELTQEAYRPLRIKYSICCPILGGYPISGQGGPEGYPLSGPGWNTLLSRPGWGTSWKGSWTSGSIMGSRYNPRCRQTDTSENSTFPSYYVRRR